MGIVVMKKEGNKINKHDNYEILEDLVVLAWNSIVRLHHTEINVWPRSKLGHYL